MTRGSLKTSCQVYLGDIGSSFYSATDLNDSIQDAYTEIGVFSQAIRKKATVSLSGNQNYFDLKAILADYLGCVAVFDPARNVFLNDFLPWPKGFRAIRLDWELMYQTPDFWAPVDKDQICLLGRNNAAHDYVIYYLAVPPTLSADGDTLLLPDVANLSVEEYVQADLLEQFNEITKAMIHWGNYEQNLARVINQTRNIAKSDLNYFFVDAR